MSTQRDTTSLRKIAEQGARTYNDETHPTAAQLIEWTARNCGHDFVIASNMQDAVLIDVCVKNLTKAGIAPEDITILFLDTGFHFPETLGMRDAIPLIYGVKVLSLEPEISVEEQDKLYGKNLFAHDPASCCNMRKVKPLERNLPRFSAWITGLRRVESPTRANAPFISYDEKFDLIKINPLVAWSDEEFQQYIDDNGIIVNPLVDDGYLSIGCAPCTNKPLPGADPRSGRWQGFNKTECGLHVQK